MLFSLPRHPSPIYHLLHQEIKRSVDTLLQLSQEDICSDQILLNFCELLILGGKMGKAEIPHPLIEVKEYLERTTLSYSDGKVKGLMIRISEAIIILSQGSPELKIHRVLLMHFHKYFLKNASREEPYLENSKFSASGCKLVQFNKSFCKTVLVRTSPSGRNKTRQFSFALHGKKRRKNDQLI